MTITTLTTTASIVREDDLIQHIEDTSELFWVFRNGRNIKRSWNELTATEKAQQIEAQRRAAYCATFDIY
jgi:hypothetical protein